MATQQPSSKPRKKGPKLTKDGKITVFDAEDTSYGIRELIDLIRYIPDGQDVFFGAEMIKKTLASMQISVHDIMQDGVEKRKLAAKTIQHLVAEISDYQRRIQSLKSHIRHLRFELGEIQDTCHYLLSDDAELSQYQHILDEVARSPIEGDDENENTTFLNSNTVTAETTHQETQNNNNNSSEKSQDQLQQNEPLIRSEDEPSHEEQSFVPDAFTNPDEEYTESQEPSLSNLTDEVFNPDRFDDDNGVVNAQKKSNNTQPAINAPFPEEATPTNDKNEPPSDDFAQRL